jgi:hypothetical protein
MAGVSYRTAFGAGVTLGCGYTADFCPPLPGIAIPSRPKLPILKKAQK